MNHSIPGVNAGYITRHKLLGDHLRQQQQAISRAIFACVDALSHQNEVVRVWLGRGGARRMAPGIEPEESRIRSYSQISSTREVQDSADSRWDQSAA
jgi:hypothetical protein